jgi:ComF family protein
MSFFSRLHAKLRTLFNANGFVCDGCGKEIFNYPVQRFCDDCEEKLCPTPSLHCPKCGRRTSAQGICLDCKQNTPVFTRGFAPFVYLGETARYINRMKNGKRRLALYFGERMAEYFLRECSQSFGQDALLIVPVPTTAKREKERGYNQAEELATAVCERLKTRGVLAETDKEILQKRYETAEQKHLNKKERRENIAGAYHVRKRTVCKGRTVLLVDDIHTTGATGDECAARLLRVGAAQVYFLTVATLPEQK